MNSTMPTPNKIKYPNIELCESINEECLCMSCSNPCFSCNQHRNKNINPTHEDCPTLTCPDYQKIITWGKPD